MSICRKGEGFGRKTTPEGVCRQRCGVVSGSVFRLQSMDREQTGSSLVFRSILCVRCFAGRFFDVFPVRSVVRSVFVARVGFDGRLACWFSVDCDVPFCVLGIVLFCRSVFRCLSGSCRGSSGFYGADRRLMGGQRVVFLWIAALPFLCAGCCEVLLR